ncbi:MAG: hypothetical protein H0X13_09955 [Ramlibacter sp.]|nr:hypothetical protein [Ramlibacter sp.]
MDAAAADNCCLVQEPLPSGIVRQVVKRHLRFKKFGGTSKNSVKPQI